MTTVLSYKISFDLQLKTRIHKIMGACAKGLVLLFVSKGYISSSIISILSLASISTNCQNFMKLVNSIFFAVKDHQVNMLLFKF